MARVTVIPDNALACNCKDPGREVWRAKGRNRPMYAGDPDCPRCHGMRFYVHQPCERCEGWAEPVRYVGRTRWWRCTSCFYLFALTPPSVTYTGTFTVLAEPTTIEPIIVAPDPPDDTIVWKRGGAR